MHGSMMDRWIDVQWYRHKYRLKERCMVVQMYRYKVVQIIIKIKIQMHCCKDRQMDRYVVVQIQIQIKIQMHGCKDGQMDRQIYTSWIRGYNRYLHMTDRQIESSRRQIDTLRLKIDRYWPLKDRLIDRQLQNLEYSTSLTRTRSCDLRPCYIIERNISL